MNNSVVSLSAQALMKLYDQLSFEQQQAFNLTLATNIRRTQLKEIGVADDILEILEQDTWLRTELQTGVQDTILKYQSRLVWIQKRARKMQLVDDPLSGMRIVYINFYDTNGDEWVDFNFAALKDSKIPISKWYVSKAPNSDHEAVVVSERQG